MNPRTRARTPSSIASNQSPKSKWSAATAASFVLSFVMAWSPFQRANAGIVWVRQPGDYANPIPTTSATGPLAGQELLRNLTFELNAVRAVLGHELPSFESPARRSIHERPTVRPKGPTPHKWG